MRRRDRAGPSAVCDCGLAPFVGISRSARNPGRRYANCPNFPAVGHCKYFAWLDAGRPSPVAPSAVDTAQNHDNNVSSTSLVQDGPSTPERAAPEPRGTTLPAWAALIPRTSLPGKLATRAPQPAQHHTTERFAALLVVVCDGPKLLLPAARAAGKERVRLVLLPASAHPPEYCTNHLAQHVAEGRLPKAIASLSSLQPPYVTLRHCPAAHGVSAAVGWPPRDGGLFVLDCETTGLSRGRDYIHQLAVLNLASCQLLTMLLRTCPRTIGRGAAEACGANNNALHDPNRPTFGQLAPLLHAFIETGSSTSAATQPPLLVAHNGGFDAGMLVGEWVRRGLPVPQTWRVLDTLPLARAAVSDCVNHKQGTLRRYFGVQLALGEVEHDAGTDVTVLAQLLPFLVKACGAGTLHGVLEGQVCRKNGASFARTFGDVQANLLGAMSSPNPSSATAVAFTCGFCHARVVE